MKADEISKVKEGMHRAKAKKEEAWTKVDHAYKKH
jgi:hypothetical protein